VDGRLEVVAHRGASAYAPEHSFAAYALALQQDATTLELDVRASADGVLFVLHDASLRRTADDPRLLADLTAAELDELPEGVRPLRLDAVLDRFVTHWLIELKDPSPAWEPAVPAAIARHGLQERVVVQSFDLSALRRLRAASPWLAVAPLYTRPPRRAAVLDAVAGFASAIGVWHRAIDGTLVARAHARGLGVRAWTTNHPADIDRMLAAGVDGVITDVPDVAQRVAQSVAHAA